MEDDDTQLGWLTESTGVPAPGLHWRPSSSVARGERGRPCRQPRGTAHGHHLAGEGAAGRPARALLSLWRWKGRRRAGARRARRPTGLFEGAVTARAPDGELRSLGRDGDRRRSRSAPSPGSVGRRRVEIRLDIDRGRRRRRRTPGPVAGLHSRRSRCPKMTPSRTTRGAPPRVGRNSPCARSASPAAEAPALRPSVSMRRCCAKQNGRRQSLGT